MDERPPILTVDSVGDGVFALSGSIDIGTEDTFRAWFDEFVAGDGRVTLDLSDVSFLDSTGIRHIVALSSRLGERHLVLAGVSRRIRATLVIAGIDRRPGIEVRAADD
jgi:anti-anti-sigma factor